MSARWKDAGVWGFYPIVPTASEVEALLDLGVRSVQLRCKSADPALRREQVARAVAAGQAVPGAQVVINDHWSDALEAGAAWIHLGQEDLDVADVSAIHASGVGLGISSHSPGERRRAVASGAAYVALGPIFETTLKRMRFAPQGLSRLRQWCDAVDVPVVAIGGITAARVPAVFDAGVRAIAVVSAVRSADGTRLDPDAVRAWMNLWNPSPDTEQRA